MRTREGAGDDEEKEEEERTPRLSVLKCVSMVRFLETRLCVRGNRKTHAECAGCENCCFQLCFGV